MKIFTNLKNFKSIIITSFFFRIVLVSIGNGYDFYSWSKLGHIKQIYFSHYGVMRQYNYGPLFAEIISVFWKISEKTNSIILETIVFSFPSSYPVSVSDVSINIGLNFKLFLVLFIFFVDILIMSLLIELYNTKLAKFWIINPLSIVISSFWLREDSIMILFFLSFIYFYKKNKTKEAILTLSLSLITKQLFIFFPIWLVFKNFKKNYVFLLSYLIYGLSFVPYILNFSNKDVPKSHLYNDIAIYGIFNDVINYSASNQFPLLSILKLIGIDSYPNWGSVLFYLLMFFVGFLNKDKRIELQFIIYLFFIVGFAPGFQANYVLYLIIPLYLISKFFITFISLYFSILTVSVGNYYFKEVENIFNLVSNVAFYPPEFDTFLCLTSVCIGTYLTSKKINLDTH